MHVKSFPRCRLGYPPLVYLLSFGGFIVLIFAPLAIGYSNYHGQPVVEEVD
jgi:hypothetical protein